MSLSTTINGVACEFGHGASISRPETGPATFEGALRFEDVADRPVKGDILRAFSGSAVLFSGPIDDEIRITGVEGSGGDAVEVHVTAHDFNVLATRRKLEPGWFVAAGTSLKTIAEAIVGYIPGAILDPSHPDGPNISVDMAAGKSSPAEASDFATQDTGWRWRVREVGSDIVYGFYDPTTENAPFNIPDGMSDYLDGDLQVTYGSGDYANSVTIFGDGVIGTASDSGEIAAKNLYEFQGESKETDQSVVDGIAAVLLAVKLPLWELAEVEYPTLTDGLWSGQTQDIVQSKRGVNSTFLLTEVDIVLAAQAEYTIRAAEGIVWRPGWRQLTKEMFGGGSLGSLPTVSGGGSGGGGGLSFIRAWMYFGFGVTAVPAAAPDDYVFVSDWEQEIDTVSRGTTSVAMTARVRAFAAGVKVKLRLWNVALNAPATGVSAQVTTPSADSNGITPFTTVTWTVSADAGSDRYRLQASPDTAGVPVEAMAAGI